MARNILVLRDDGSSPILTEVWADSEEELQRLVKDHADLLPIEDLEMSGPLLVVGMETTLPSGGVDLVAIARSGELLIVEFKMGPGNPDFRRALAQLVDYGSDLWRMSFSEFESTVATRYFASHYCQDPRLRNKRTLEEGARAVWPDFTSEAMEQLRERLDTQLQSGAFHYVLVAQRFIPTIERSIEYLNATSAARFSAVELVRFTADKLTAFEARFVVKPALCGTGGEGVRPVSVTEAQFIEAIQDDQYHSELVELLEAFRGLGLRLGWGSVGVSVRMPTPDRAEPLTIAWLFPPGRSGWMGLRDLTLGFDTSSSSTTPSVQPALDEYVSHVANLTGAEAVHAKGIRGHRVGPEALCRQRNAIVEIVAELVQRSSGGE